MENLEGTIFKYHDQVGNTVDAIVVGYDKDIGISAAFLEDRDRMLICLAGPSSPSHLYVSPDYEDLFDITTMMIKRGHFHTETFNLTRRHGYYPKGNGLSHDMCPFNQ